MAGPFFYNQGDQNIYKDYKFVPQEKYRTGFTAPIKGGGEDASTFSFGIPNTNAFINSGGDKNLNTYVGQVGQYSSAPVSANLAGATYPGGFQSNEGGFEYTNSFPDTSVQMQNLNYEPQGYNRMGGYLDKSFEDGVGTGIPSTNFKGVAIAPSFDTSGVRTVKGNLSKIANPDIFNSYGASVKDPQVTDVGFENYSQSAFDETEEEEKQGFIANMVSRAKQIGSDLPGWAKVAASTLIGGPFAAALSFGFNKGDGTGANYQQYTPDYNYRGLNSSMINDFYDSNPNSPTFGTNRFDRAPIGSFRSFRTLAGYLNRDKNVDGKTIGGTGTAAATDTSQGQTGYGSCFIAGTKVTMADGILKNIEDVKVGDKVKGHKENNEVIKLDPTLLGDRKLYSFNNNEHYFFTSEHPFMTEEGWKSVKPEKTKERDGIELYNQLEGELKICDKLVTDKGLIEITDIKSKEINKPDMPLYNFNVSNDNSYIADGYVVHNKGGTTGNTSGSNIGGANEGNPGANQSAQGHSQHMRRGGLASIL